MILKPRFGSTPMVLAVPSGVDRNMLLRSVWPAINSSRILCRNSLRSRKESTPVISGWWFFHWKNVRRWLIWPRHDGGQIPFLAATNQRHGRTATRRFGHTDFNVRHWNEIEAGERRSGARIREEERHRRSIARGLLQQPSHKLSRRLAYLERCLRNDLADSARAHWLLIEHPCKVVLDGAGEHVFTLDQHKAALVTATPCGLHLCGIKLGERVGA